MELVPISKEAGLDSGAKRSLQQKFEEGRGVDDDHADSRSSRMTTAAGVFNVTRFRLWIRVSISSRVGSRGQTFKFGQEVIGERLSRVRRPDLQLAVQRVRHIPDLDHLGHVISMRACWSHVKARANNIWIGGTDLCRFARSWTTGFKNDRHWDPAARPANPPFIPCRLTGRIAGSTVRPGGHRALIAPPAGVRPQLLYISARSSCPITLPGMRRDCEGDRR